jgi:predicted Holliday junction resolvase-like endonuclease
MEIVIIFVLLLIIILLLFKMGAQNKEKVEREAEKLFEQWKKKQVPSIREDAIRGSQAVTLGKSLEHLIPYFPDFPYNPKDVRFLGSPIDLIVFDGLSEGNLREVVFIEVKTGKSARLPLREKQLKECLKDRRVSWDLLHYKKMG